jgi:hypothetical protein
VSADAGAGSSREAYMRAAQPLLDELAALGFRVHRVNELRRHGARYAVAVPVLVRALERATDPMLVEELARVLAVPWAAPALRPLIEAFRRAPNSPPPPKAALAAAIEALADDSVAEELLEIARAKEHGNARELVVLALAKLDDERAPDVLEELLHDRGVGGHALTALLRIVPRRGLRLDPAIAKPFLRDGRAWVRRDAKDLLQALERLG